VGGGWLSDRLGSRKGLLLFSAAALIPASLLMTQATDVAELTITTSITWFFVGIAHAMVNVLTGLNAAPEERGKVFGLIAMAVRLGALIAGLSSGWIVDRWGFHTLFVVLAGMAGLVLLVALFVEDKHMARPTPQKSAAPAEHNFGTLFYLLLLANLVANLTLFVGNLGRPLTMTRLGFDAAAISSGIAVSAAVLMPFPLLVGWLSDKLGRGRFLTLCYLAGSAGILILIPAESLWHFWLSTSVTGMISISAGVAQAYVADLVPAKAMGQGMSLLNTTVWLAGTLGFGGAGLVIQALGMNTTLLLAAFLPLIAAALLTRLRQPVVAPSLA
jgi:MFS family permease